MSTDLLNATISERQDLTSELSIIRIRPDRGRVPPFEPGQFITIGLPQEPTPVDPTGARPKPVRLTRRAYSIASSAQETHHLELYLVLVKEGSLTPRLWHGHPGQRLWMDDKAKGHFTLTDIPRDKDLVLVSTGTGIAPFISMLRTYRGTGRWNRCVIIHGVRIAADLGYRQELEQASANDPTIVYVPTVTREPPGSPWSGLRGRVQAALDPDIYLRAVGAPLTSEQCHVLLCGNPEMIKSVQVDLEQRGFVTQKRGQSGNVHFERYW